ncbi:MAG: F0F1 ATP synthase subunit gamma [Clostridiales bacterium]|nr:F0F1 ATP synthase subunit gamma [Clostridiales bacterium]
MKSLNEVNENLNTIRQTRRVTNAMYLLSASHARRGMAHISYNDTYMRRISASVKDILSKSPEVKCPFFERKKGDGASYFLVLGGNKGLCGAYNSDVVNAAVKKIKSCENAVVHVSGLIVADMLRNKGITVDKEWQGITQFPSIHACQLIKSEVSEMFLSGKIKEAFVIFTDYRTPVSQVVVTRRLLPLSTSNFDDIELECDYKADKIIYEPSVETVFEKIVGEYIVGYLYGCLYNALVSENYIRMTAMRNATDNADEMIKKLDKEYNEVRQLTITNELTEIASVADLMNSAI